ncbi:MAG: hypothetical protein RL685_4254 [Pseudomonadota bacterium]|jgi:hypothetical protein
MYPALVVLWLTAPPARPEPQPEVARWAAERGFRAVTLPMTPEPPYAEAIALEIEGLLEDARGGAPGAAGFARLDQLLAEHPELPQAGWWLAERYALERQHVRDIDSEQAAAVQLEQRRAALEGPRAAVAGGGEAAEPGAALPAQPLELIGLRPRDQLLLDGQFVATGTTMTTGRHHAQLFRARRSVWAGWIELESAQLQLPERTAPCSDLDLLGTEYATDSPRPAPGVRCPAWAVAHAHPGGLELALCRADRCEPWQPQSTPSSARLTAATSLADPAEHMPAWLTWGAVGLGAAASTALVLWQAGVFDRPAPATEFVFTGPSAAAVRF